MQAYVHFPKKEGLPTKELKGFQRVSLKPNEEREAVFEIPKSELEKWDAASHSWKLTAGDYKIVVGGNSADEKLSAPIPF